MGKLQLNGSVTDLLAFYRREHRIYGRCPHCSKPFRLSEVKLTYGQQPPADVLKRLKKERDQLKVEIDELTEQIESLEGEHEEALEDLKSNHEHKLEKLEQHFADKVEIQIERGIKKREKEIRKDAIERSRCTSLGKLIERITPMFKGFGHHPGDVRPLFEPLDFIIFDGLFRGHVTDVYFVEFKTGNGQLNEIQRSIRDAVARKRVSFELARMTPEMQRKLEAGKRLTNTPAITTQLLR